MASQGTARAASGLRTGLRRPLASRPLDILWIAFFALHLSASLLIDSQAFVPRRLVPAPLSRLLQQYLADSRDPLITAALRRDPSYAWFITALALELCVQCPAFAAGIWGSRAGFSQAGQADRRVGAAERVVSVGRRRLSALASVDRMFAAVRFTIIRKANAGGTLIAIPTWSPASTRKAGVGKARRLGVGRSACARTLIRPRAHHR
jgi:hypothetical protein